MNDAVVNEAGRKMTKVMSGSEGLVSSGGGFAGCGKWATGKPGGFGAGQPEWWVSLPAGERTLLQAIAGMLRSAKRSQVQEVARAAAKWERGIGCFIKVRLMYSGRKRWGAGDRGRESGGRIQESGDGVKVRGGKVRR